jgi:hypothetical protein
VMPIAWMRASSRPDNGRNSRARIEVVAVK